MYPVIHITDQFQIPLYALCFFVGFLLAVIFAMKTAQKQGMDKFDLLYAALYAAIGIGVGAKVFFFLSRLPKILIHFDTYKEMIKVNPGAALNYAFGGLVFYGGLFGAVLGVYIYCKHFKVPIMPIISIFTPLIPFVHGFGRIGCFFAGCCYGIPYSGPFAIQFPYNVQSPQLSLVPRFPVQLLEALLNFIFAAILFYLRKKKSFSAPKLLGSYFLYYAIARFFLEYVRGDLERGKYRYFSTSQLISVLLLPIAIYLNFYGKNKKRKSE